MAKVTWTCSPAKLAETFTSRPAQMQLVANALADAGLDRAAKKDAKIRIVAAMTNRQLRELDDVVARALHQEST